MAVSEKDRRIARAMWGVAAGMVESRDPEARDVARLALAYPTPENIRSLVIAGRGREWLPSVIDALAQVGIAASEDVLSDIPTYEELMSVARPATGGRGWRSSAGCAAA